MNPLRDILTGIDGASYSVAKVCGVLAVFVYLALWIAAFVTGKPFDGIAFGTGAGLVIGAMGLAVKMNETSEPKKDQSLPPSKDPP